MSAALSAVSFGRFSPNSINRSSPTSNQPLDDTIQKIIMIVQGPVGGIVGSSPVLSETPTAEIENAYSVAVPTQFTPPLSLNASK